jgi:hypothetical protein
MANTIKTTNRTIEVSAIDSDYSMGVGLNVQSVHFIPGAVDDVVDIIEVHADSPVKCRLMADVTDEPRTVYFDNQRLRLGFVFANGTFSAGSKVIFNIGERR